MVAVRRVNYPQQIINNVLRPFEIMRSNIDVSYYVTKLALRCMKAIGLILRSTPVPFNRLFSVLKDFEMVLDTALIFPSAGDVNRKPISAKRWLFLGATVAGVVLFCHEISLVSLGGAAVAIGTVSLLLLVGGYGVGVVKHSVHAAKGKPQRSATGSPRWLKIAHGVSSVVFYTASLFSALHPGVLVTLGIVSASFGVIKAYWRPMNLGRFTQNKRVGSV